MNLVFFLNFLRRLDQFTVELNPINFTSIAAIPIKFWISFPSFSFIGLWLLYRPVIYLFLFQFQVNLKFWFFFSKLFQVDGFVLITFWLCPQSVGNVEDVISFSTVRTRFRNGIQVSNDLIRIDSEPPILSDDWKEMNPSLCRHAVSIFSIGKRHSISNISNIQLHNRAIYKPILTWRPAPFYRC